MPVHTSLGEGSTASYAGLGGGIDRSDCCGERAWRRRSHRKGACQSQGLLGRIVIMNVFKALSAATLIIFGVGAADSKPQFRVIAFFTGKQDQAHISFLHEAERWFPEMAAKYNFGFDTTSNWNNLNSEFLARYQVVVFLDTRPEEPAQRAAFQAYMEHGGAWMGFHFAGFALTPSDRKST